MRFISADEEKTGREAVRYLYGRGHRRILHLTYAREAYAIVARARGYKKEATALGLRPLVVTGGQKGKWVRLVKEEGVTAIFCHNDWLALTALLALSEAGVRVPEDVSVLGVDNSPTLVALHPELTTMAYPMGAVGEAIVDILDGGTGRAAGMAYRMVERATVRDI